MSSINLRKHSLSDISSSGSNEECSLKKREKISDAVEHFSVWKTVSDLVTQKLLCHEDPIQEEPTGLSLEALCQQHLASVTRNQAEAQALLQRCRGSPDPDIEFGLLLYFLERDGKPPPVVSHSLLHVRLREMTFAINLLFIDAKQPT